MQENPYAQNKAELIARRLHADPEMKLSPTVFFVGGLFHASEVVKSLIAHCGLPEDYQVKFNAGIGALRISDYHTRHVGEAGTHFWLFGGVIMGGSIAEHEQLAAISSWAGGHRPEPDEADMTAQNWAIVTALKALRKER
jgi:hypothetical protein